MGRLAAILVLSGVMACGGSVDGPAPAPAESGPYTREAAAMISITPPGAVEILGVSCERGETLIAGSCDVAAGGVLVESAEAGVGWACSATSSRDEVRLHVWIRCARP